MFRVCGCWLLGWFSSCLVGKLTDNPSLHTGGLTIIYPLPILNYLCTPLDILWSLDQNRTFLRFHRFSESYIFGSVPFPVRLTRPDRRLELFPRVSGCPCDGAVNHSHFKLGVGGWRLFCFVWISWSVDLNGGAISDTWYPDFRFQIWDTMMVSQILTKKIFFKTESLSQRGKFRVKELLAE